MLLLLLLLLLPVGNMGASNGEHSMLKKCFWKGRRLDCAAIFTVFPTDRGMCCTFNMKEVGGYGMSLLLLLLLPVGNI